MLHASEHLKGRLRTAPRSTRHSKRIFTMWTLAIDNGHCGARAPPARLPRERNPGPVAAACPPPRIHVHITPSPIAIQRFTANLYNIHRAWATSPHICFVASAHHNHGPLDHGFQGQGEGRTHTSTCSSPSLWYDTGTDSSEYDGAFQTPGDHCMCIERSAAGPAAALKAAASLEPFAKSRPRPRYMVRSSSTAAALKSPPCWLSSPLCRRAAILATRPW